MNLIIYSFKATYLNLNLILYGTKDSPQKRSVENFSKSDSLKNEVTYEKNFSENVNHQEHKNRKAHGTNEDNQSANLISNKQSTSLTTLDESKNFVIKNKLFQNSVFDQDYDLKSNKDYMTELFKENNLYDNYANDEEEYLDDSYEYKITSGHMFRDNKLIPSSERSSILELKYSAKTINSIAVRFQSKLYTQFYLVILILLF